MPVLDELLHEVRSCRVCEAALPLGPRPVVRASATARVLIIGQAPGTRVHATGIPWNDPSGERLRHWLAIPPDVFYDVGRIAIMPMGFCYPGRGRGGDMPPRPECAPLWHPPLLAAMPGVELVLLVGQYAQKRYLPGCQASLTENVRPFLDPAIAREQRWFPLPHPSPRNTRWLRQRPWFEAQVVPVLRQRLRSVLG
ncbi:uracil-DNA glycosylase family protein [Alcanivorax sp. JB21]|uniref:uracil-DNA glycosylase family protein n=1 Tax=Alcanivorax limicola TaxID=2874102 RepID=UPI001CBBC3FA|nr:uracil-DNA glycosylase family protein [Alcanivorax limicola]MBZ2188039.1 uracil-DNA glycosylase family protein [Alcanivorax limicola]